MPQTYEPIATQTLTSSASSVTFSSIPGTYTDLVLVFAGTSVTGSQNVGIRFNSDSGTNYSRILIYGTGSSALGAKDNSVQAINFLYPGTGQSTGRINIFSYSNTTTYKTTLSRFDDSAVVTNAAVGLWRSTAAITSITIIPADYNLASGCTLTLYGIKAA